MKLNHIYQGDSLEVLKTFEDKSINCCMSSPPYWALRDYGITGQLGLEKTFDEFIDKLCDIYDEVKRVLRKDGTCWVNLGDTYNSGGNFRVDNLEKDENNKFINEKAMHKIQAGRVKVNPNEQGIPQKCLTMIPQRFAIEMINRGWILRNTIIWHKPNCMPSSVKDRFTVDFEYIFFFVKNKKYWFDLPREKRKYDYDKGIEYERKNPICNSVKITKEDRNRIRSRGVKNGFSYEKSYNNPLGRAKRTVWKISPKPFPEAHFAVYPEELCEIPLKSGCPKGGIVLDPFMGSGTTGLVALKQNKKFIGIELNKEYIEIANRRLKPFLEQTKLTDIK